MVANGVSVSVVNVTVLDCNSQPLADVNIELHVDHESGVTFYQPQTATDQDGCTWGLVFSTEAETKTIAAWNVTSADSMDHRPLDSRATVQFVTEADANAAEDSSAPLMYYADILDGTQNSNGPWEITSRVVDNFPMSVVLVYSTADEPVFEDTLLMTDANTGSAHVFSAIIPEQDYNTTVSYFVQATDAAGNISRRPESGHASFAVLDSSPLAPGDIDANEKLNIFDLLGLLNIISGKTVPDARTREAADLDDNGKVDIFDLLVLLNKMLPSAKVGD